MYYATGAAFNLSEMFLNFKTDKLKITCKQCKEINGNEHRDLLVKKIFRECYKMVLDDIIENNVTFYLPVSPKLAYIHMKRVKGEEFKKARQAGKWKGVDILSSLFSGYELLLTIENKNKVPKSKTIYVDKNLKDKITNNTNMGKQYC